jgi:heterodisulfide reductase subunit D
MRNYYGAPPLARTDWATRARFPASAYTVLFVGCTMSYELLPLARRTVKILDSAKMDFTILGTDEWCCGHPLLLTGQEEEFRRVAQHNLEAVERRGAGRLVTGCPGCYRAFKRSYPRMGMKPPFEVMHISELISELLDSGRLKLGRHDGPSREMVYHDPCLLGRLGGVTEAPRKVLESLPGGKKVLEFENNRDNSICCGGGGVLRAIEEAMCADIASKKVREAIELGAGTIVSSCPSCRINLGDGVRKVDEGKGGPGIETRDLVELVSRAL